jgi:pimeloyl-ACP methyl ester carboxylesterase
MPKLPVNGVNIYYEAHGEGFPVILTEGFVGTTAMWQPQVEALSPHCRLILYDIRGQGWSDAPADASEYSLESAVGDIYALLKHLGAEQAVVGGLSLGGYLSLHFYREHPEMVKGLIMADTGPGYRNPERREQWIKECQERAELIENGGMHAFLHSPWAADDYYTPHIEMLKLDPKGIANVSRGIMSSAWGVELLPEVNVPVLLICGEHDTPFIGPTEFMASKLPRATKAIIPDACHACNMDNPEAFNRAVLDFLAELGVSK